MLPPILTKRLSDLFQDSEHIRNLGMARAPDTDVWEFAKKMGYGIVTKDRDFANLSLVWGAPPKVILLQLGNCSAQQIEARIRRGALLIAEFLSNSPKPLLVITK
jgi:predicted nuclease of predicted toxin-antitoxin system